MIKEIGISKLEPGMLVVDTGLSWIDRPFVYSTEGRIRSREEIDRIAAEGYQTVFVKLGTEAAHGGLPTGPASVIGKAGGRSRAELLLVPLHKEIETAREIHTQLLSVTRDFLKDARLGRPVDFEQAKPVVGALVDSVMRNENALLTIKYLKSFDEYTFNHCINVAVVATVYGKYLGLPENRLNELCQAGVFHDLGKALIPLEILNKPGRLTKEEFDVMRGHPQLGYDLLSSVQGPSEDTLRGVLEHHEKYDGSGYPSGLKGLEQGEFARILAVSDVYDALTSERVYKQGMLPSRAMRIIYGIREADFYPGMVEGFIRCLGIYPIGSLVRLSTGENGVVIETAPGTPLLPIVRILQDKDHRLVQPREVDLAELADTLGEDAPRIESALNGLDGPLRIDRKGICEHLLPGGA
ncbi:MAG: HD-GYP domain-containing protein [Desulfovibrionaceae bacterium]